MKRVFRTLACIISIGITTSAYAQFTNGNIVVLQAGTGAAALSGVATPVVLKEYNTSGLNQSAPVSTIYVDTTGAARLTISGNEVTEGQLTLSSDSSKLVLVGYDAPINTAGISGTASSSVARAIDTVGYYGLPGRADTTKTVFSGASFRSATRNNSENYWGVGANTGVYYMGKLAAEDTIYNSTNDLRVVLAANGKLYFSTQSGLSRIGRINSQATTGFVSADTMITLGSGVTPSPYGFAVNSVESIVYVADDRSTGSGGGVQKWTRSGTVWTLAYTLSTGVSAGARSVIADWSGTFPVLYAVTSAATSTLIKLTDSNVTAPAQTLATAPTNTAFRSVAFTPKLVACTPPAAFITTSSTSTCQGYFTTLYTNSAPGLSYTWKRGGSPMAGPGTTDSFLKVTAAGVYQVVVKNSAGCKDSSAGLTITVNPVPIAAIAPGFPDTVCAGDTIHLKASAGIGYTYQWVVGSTKLPSSPDSNLHHITASSANDSVYWFYVVVTSAGNCADSSDSVGVVVPALLSPAIVNSGGVLSTGTYLHYQWYLNGVAIPGAIGMSFIPSTNGNYSVHVSNTGLCGAMSAVIAVTNVGVSNTLASQGVRLYPNPVHELLLVDAAFDVTVLIKDLQGRIVGRSEHSKHVSMRELVHGVYVVSIYNRAGSLIGSQLITRTAH